MHVVEQVGRRHRRGSARRGSTPAPAAGAPRRTRPRASSGPPIANAMIAPRRAVGHGGRAYSVPPMQPEILARYADAIVRDALRIGDGQVLAIHSEAVHRPFCLALVEAGYRAGAARVDLLYSEPEERHLRGLLAPEAALGTNIGWLEARMQELLAAGAGIVWVAGESQPGLLSDVPADRAAKLSTENIGARKRYLGRRLQQPGPVLRHRAGDRRLGAAGLPGAGRAAGPRGARARSRGLRPDRPGGRGGRLGPARRRARGRGHRAHRPRAARAAPDRPGHRPAPPPARGDGLARRHPAVRRRAVLAERADRGGLHEPLAARHRGPLRLHPAAVGAGPDHRRDPRRLRRGHARRDRRGRSGGRELPAPVPRRGTRAPAGSARSRWSTGAPGWARPAGRTG